MTKRAANDNYRHAFDLLEGWKILFSNYNIYAGDLSFKNLILQLSFKARHDKNALTSLKNYLWFVKFEHSFREQEVLYRRKEFHIIN